MNRYTLTLRPTAPYDLELTTDNQPYFRKGDGPSAAAYQRLLDLGEKLTVATVYSTGTAAEPVLSVTLQGNELNDTEISAAQDQLEKVLGLHQDLQPFYSSAATDPVMTHLTETFHGMHQSGALSVFETIAQAILGQQLSASVARVIRGLMIETYGPSLTVEGFTHYAFPRPQAIAEASVEELRALKLSWRKAEYLQGVARAETETAGGLDRVSRLEDAEVVKEITALRGVGAWTAQWVLSRALGRPDAFPLGDLALRRIVSQLYFGGETITDSQLADFSTRWSPHRSLATSYLFAALRTGRGQSVTYVP